MHVNVNRYNIKSEKICTRIVNLIFCTMHVSKFTTLNKMWINIIVDK